MQSQMGTQFGLDGTGIVKHIVDEPVHLLHKFEKDGPTISI